MNENLNLTEILRDCPEGTKLYSIILGEVTFVKCTTASHIMVYKNDRHHYFTPQGEFLFPGTDSNKDGECVLFPSKDQRDWSKFTVPQCTQCKKERFDPKTLQPFDKVLIRNYNAEDWCCDSFSHVTDGSNSYVYVSGRSIYKRCIPYNDDTKHLIGTANEAPVYYRYWED